MSEKPPYKKQMHREAPLMVWHEHRYGNGLYWRRTRKGIQLKHFGAGAPPGAVPYVNPPL